MRIIRTYSKTTDHSIYPSLLYEIPDFPKQLYCYGDTNLLREKCITVIGTRDISQYGKNVIDLLINEKMRKLGIVVASGLARGVDSFVHKTCLQRGIKTLAVVAGGIDTAIPYSNRELLQEIMGKGLVVAEYPKGTKMNKYMYIERNRILAGLSKSVLIIEAGEKSGSLTTARLGLEYNREIYVVPGNITSSVSKGCNILAREGANIITGLEDILEILCVKKGQKIIDF